MTTKQTRVASDKINSMQTRVLLALCIALSVFFSAFSHAQEFPTRPIQLIVPFPPGGVADLTGRPTAVALEKILRQPVLVVNRPGAGGATGTAQVARATADGYTLLMGLSSVSIFPVTDRINGKTPSYEMRELAPIALISADPTVLVVRADSNYKTLKDFLDAAKAQPGRLNYASSGVYGTLHVSMEILAHATGVQLFHVPYPGGGPAVAALLGGQVDALASGPSAVMGQLKAGKLRALGSWGDKRLPALPEVATFREQGLDAEFYIWSGVFAPSGTPAPVMQRLRDALRLAVQDPEFKATMAKIETPVSYLDAPEFARFWERDARRLANTLEKIGRIEEK